MQVEIEITGQPIDLRRALPEDLADEAGAVVEFQGRVREQEAGQVITALEYEAYAPMAEKVMRQILAASVPGKDCLFCRVTHRVGLVPVGEAAIHIVVAASHRAAAFALLSEFMDRLKQEVPIWKRRALTAGELAALKPS